MSDCKVAKAVLEWQDAQKRLIKLTELMEEAFVVFDYQSANSCKLDNLTNVIEKSWVRFTEYHVEFLERDYTKIWQESHRVSKALVTRQDFNELLAPYKKAIEEYHSKLEAEVEKKYQNIIKLYDHFKQFNTTQLAFIFKQEEIKEVFMQFLLS